MSSKKIAYTVLIFSLIAVAANSIYLHFSIEKITQRSEAMSVYSVDAAGNFRELHDYYKRHEHIISLTVNHDDLESIDDAYFEIIGALEVGDTNSASIAKSRLLGALSHLKRLSGINIDSII